MEQLELAVKFLGELCKVQHEDPLAIVAELQKRQVERSNLAPTRIDYESRGTGLIPRLRARISELERELDLARQLQTAGPRAVSKAAMDALNRGIVHAMLEDRVYELAKLS